MYPTKKMSRLYDNWQGLKPALTNKQDISDSITQTQKQNTY